MKKRLILLALRLFLWKVLLWWCRTLNVVTMGREPFDQLNRNGGNYVVAFWHGSMVAGWFLHRPTHHNVVAALVSQSSDGEFLSAVLERWKYSMIRGSSHIGGKEAMELMVNAVRSGQSLAITPDGPRGPKQEMKMGAVRVAQKTGVPLVLAGIALSNKHSLRSWDAFEVPIPFSTVAVVYGKPTMISPEKSGPELESVKKEMEFELRRLTHEAESIVNRGVTGK